MGTTSDKLGQLVRSKAAIRTAIINTGVNMPANEPFKNYSYYIEQISNLPESTPIEDILHLMDILECLPNKPYEEHAYSEEDINKINSMIDLIVEGGNNNE